jgi:hypothetical protein
MRTKCGEDEQASLAKLNERFRDAMLSRLLEKLDYGWSGWSYRKEMERLDGGLKERIIRNALEGDWVDVANLAMFAWNLEG